MGHHSDSMIRSKLPAQLGPDALAAALERDPEIRLLDVRTSSEFVVGHLDGSYNVPLNQLGSFATQFRSVDAPIVLVCRSGARAISAQSMLREAGVGDLHLLEGGVLAWRAARHPVQQTAGATAALVRRFVGMAAIIAALVIGLGQPILALVLGVVGFRLALGLAVMPCAAAGSCGSGTGDTESAVRACVAGIPPTQ